MKKCPYCSKAQEESLRCKYCGAILSDRRKYPRFAVYSEIRCKNFNGTNTSWIDGQLKNISLGGAFFTVSSRLSGFIVISFPITDPKKMTIDFFAKVVETIEYKNTGMQRYDTRIAFIKPRPADQSLLQEFIDLVK